MFYNPIVKRFFDLLIYLRMSPPLRNTGPQHTTSSGFFAVYLAAQNLWTVVFGLNFNVSKNWCSDFLALGFFTVTDFLSDIGLFSVNSLVVVTIDALIMELYCCWSLHFPEDLYNFLILSRHLCSYIALLLNGWSNTMVTICTSIQYNLEK